MQAGRALQSERRILGTVAVLWPGWLDLLLLCAPLPSEHLCCLFWPRFTASAPPLWKQSHWINTVAGQNFAHWTDWSDDRGKNQSPPGSPATWRHVTRPRPASTPCTYILTPTENPAPPRQPLVSLSRGAEMSIRTALDKL